MRAFLTAIVVLAVLVIGGLVVLGFSRDWFHVTVNEDKMKEDSEEAKEKVQELGKQIKDKAGETADKARGKAGTTTQGVETASGSVKKVEAADNRFLMTTADNTELTLYTSASSTIRLNDQQVGLGDLRIGDAVKVDHGLKDGKDLATSVRANRP